MAETNDNQDQDDIKTLREKADQATAAQAEAQTARRELAFVKAGIDTESKLGGLLFKTYEGDLTKDALQTEAKELGLFRDEETTPKGKASDEETKQTRQREELSSDSEDPVLDESVNIDQAFANFHKARKSGATQDEASKEVLGTIFEGASKGQEEFLVKE